MRIARLATLPLAFGFLIAAFPLSAQVPAGSTGICGDGTYTKAKTKTGACSNHGGVKTWLGDTPAPAPAPKPAPPPAKPAAPTRPASATGMCTDGSFTTAKNKAGACSNHGGVKDWYYATTTTAPPPPAPAPRPAPPPPARPTGATGMCTDGSYTTAKNKSGACSNHGGVKDWYYATTSPAPPPPPPPAAAPTSPNIKVAPIPGAPAAATALCNDGTWSESQHRSGTCSNHKGVKQWLKNIPPQ